MLDGRVGDAVTSFDEWSDALRPEDARAKLDRAAREATEKALARPEITEEAREDHYRERFPPDRDARTMTPLEVCRRIASGYYSASKSARGAARDALDEDEEPPEPSMDPEDSGPIHEQPSYRESMKDAGRGHLLP